MVQRAQPTSPKRRAHFFVAALPVVVLGAVATLAGSAPPALAAGSPPSSACTGTLGGLLVSGGSGQAARAGTAFADPLAAEVVDTGGCPLANVDVEFVAPTSGASATFPGSATTATVASGSDGVTDAPSLTANDVSGSYSVLAEVASTSYQVSFELTNTTSGVAATVGVSSGNNQSGQVGEQFSLPLAVKVLDSYGAPVGDANVNFNIVPTNGAGASFVGGGTTVTDPTDQTGTATSPSLVAGTTAGTFTVQANVSGASKPVTFTLTDLASAPYAITPGAGTSQEAQLGMDFAVPLAVTVTDSNGNPVAGAQVTFSAPSGGASGVFAGHGTTITVVASSKGVAVAPKFSANEVAGGYVVTARVAGLASVATFALVDTARTEADTVGPAGSYWLATGNGQVLPSGAAAQYAAPAGRALPSHVVGMAATPDGHGYWLVTKSGQPYPFGDARSYGSAANSDLAAPIVGLAATPDGRGYWLATSSGSVYAFGDAHYYGSERGSDLVSPIVGIAGAPSGRGYWLVAKNGGVLSFGQATYYGSADRFAPSPVVAFMPAPDGGGYWVVSANGAVTGFGDAGSQGPAVAKGTVVAGAAFG